MNSYTIHFRYAREHVEAADSDMAVMAAAEIIARDISEEDRGDLVAVELHDEAGSGSRTFYAGDYNANSARSITERATMWHPKLQPAAPELPPRSAGGMTLNIEDGDLFVTFFGYSSSLLAASNECELLSGHAIEREPYQLTPAQQRIVDEWDKFSDDYLTPVSI